MDFLDLLMGDLRRVLPPPLGPLVLVIVSVVCGAIVGIERERAEKPAGLRTLLLICLGSTVFTLMSTDSALGPAAPRIAAQIVTGVGFLGAGAILREGGGVVGLTTAASIWVVAAVGIVVGAGYALAGLALASAIVVTLTLLSRTENRYIASCEMVPLHMIYQTANGTTRMRVQGILDSVIAPVDVVAEKAVSPEQAALELRYCRRHRHHRIFVGKLAELPEIVEMESDAPLTSTTHI
jgi:putative Mg2+ transporter-C (MgtC) family protein